MRWQKRARFGVAIFGIVFAAIVYLAIGERQAASQAPRPTRLDPKAILESAGAILQQFREARQDYEITAERQLTYEGGATKLVGISIKVRGRAGRDFVVTGREAQAAEDQKQLEISGDVTLMASDGFVVTAQNATFNEADATVHVPGAVAFEKGRMSGSGVGMSYDQDNDVLTLSQEAHVEVTDDAGNTMTDFTAGSATLDRQEDYLALLGNVHVLRGEQVLEADQGIAQLSDNEEYITFIELRGSSRVAGGGAFDSMTARDIDLDYTDDGQVLERVALTGDAAIVMLGRDGGSGRQFLGESLNLTFAPDKSLTAIVGRQNVRVDLPAAASAPARSVKARALDAAGEAGKGLTTARFTDDVEYREEPRAGGAPRLARSRALQITLADDVVTTALFTGTVHFEEQGLQAAGANAQYDPTKGTLRLSGVDGGPSTPLGAGGPRVADEQISIEANAIEITLQGRQMTASGSVKTTLRPRPAGGTKLPGLLEQGQPANANANTLEYAGAAGKAVYTGAAALWQGETAVRANVITIDQTTGDLLASGSARSTLMLDAETSIGSGTELRYHDATRRIVYGPPPSATGRGVVAPPVVVQSRLSGPQGDLRADRIELVLARSGGRAERLEAYTNVSVRLDTRVATGDRLTYYAEDERYLMSGIATVPVKILESCRETTGRTVTFFKSTERIIVDGNEETRTQSKRGGPCPQPPAR